MTRFLSGALILLVAGFGLWFNVPATPAADSGPARPASSRSDVTPAEKVRGMTISCPTSGREWGTDEMVASMRLLKELGVNWITIHPYAHVERDGEIRGYYGKSRGVPDYVTRPIAEAHRLGLKLMMKPHISYWGSFSWRGAVNFQDEAEWQRFFSGYEAWLFELAAACKDADAFVVGTELEGTTHHEARWRSIIKGVRERYPGPLTYAANWSDYHKVPFWDAVDVVGLQAYFPLLSGEPGSIEPTEERLRSGWQRVMGEVRTLARATGKNVVFTELGYDRSPRAPFEPWAHGDTAARGTAAEALQVLCHRVALQCIAAEPHVHGAFLWKWFPGEKSSRNFEQSSPAMRRLIAEQWSSKKQ